MEDAEQNQKAFKAVGQAIEQQFNIAIDVDGRWFHEGKEIRRQALVKLFATALKQDCDGVFWLETPIEKGRIDVADAPFIATAMALISGDGIEGEAEAEGSEQSIRFTTNVGDKVPLDRAHPINLKLSSDGTGLCPYIEVRNGLLAKLSRPVYYELAELASNGDDGKLGVWSNNIFFVLE